MPDKIAIEPYIELLNNYRPQFIDLSKRLVEDSSNGNELSIGALTSAITAINADIERITRERRYMVLEALVGFATRNPSLAVGGMVAAALGLSNHLVGCGAATVAGAASEGAKRLLKIRGSDAGNRLLRKLRSDIQPILDKVIAQYLGTNVTDACARPAEGDTKCVNTKSFDRHDYRGDSLNLLTTLRNPFASGTYR